MCKIGDVIVVKKYISEDGKEMKGHSFVVVEDESGRIAGLDYTMVAQVMSSLDGKPEEYKSKKLRYKENKQIEFADLEPTDKKINTKSGFVKADKFYYFNKDNLEYIVLCRVEEQWFNELIELIVELKLEDKLKDCIHNLEEIPS